MGAQRCGNIIDTPSRGRAVVIRWFAGGNGHHGDLVSGGKSAAADLAAAHPEARRAPARDTGGATDARYGDHSAPRRRFGDLAAGRGRLPAGSGDNGTPTLEG